MMNRSRCGLSFAIALLTFGGIVGSGYGQAMIGHTNVLPIHKAVDEFIGSSILGPSSTNVQGMVDFRAASPFLGAGVVISGFSPTPSIIALLPDGTGASAFAVYSNVTPGGPLPSPLFSVLSNGSTGFGTSSPQLSAEFVRNQSTAQIGATTYAPTSAGANFIGRAARGSQSAPEAVRKDDLLAMFSGRGYYYDPITPGFSGGRARMAIHAASDFTSTMQPAYITFDTTPSGSTAVPMERMRVTPEGKVLIGTTTPLPPWRPIDDEILQVNGSINVSGNINAKFQDVAEWVEVSGDDVSAGTVVVLDQNRTNTVSGSTTSYDEHVAGVVTREPGISLGQPGAGKTLIATTGRVRVKADATWNPIRIGDLLVTSDKPGFAMKSVPIDVGGRRIHQAGTLLGKALEPLPSGQGEILVLLSLQ